MTTAAVTASNEETADSTMFTYFSIVGGLFLLTLFLGAINVLIWYCDKKRHKFKLWQLKRDCRRFGKEEVDKEAHWSMTMSKKKKKSSPKRKSRKGMNTAAVAPTSLADHVPF